MIGNLTLHQLRCFDAVVNEGSFQAAALKLCRSQPTIFAAVKSLENQLGLVLLDRSGYRVGITEAGQSFHRRTRGFLNEYDKLEIHASQLAMGQEAELSVVIGDLCPLASTISLLRRFFDTCPDTKLHLHVEAIGGPWERLRDGVADLTFHHLEKADPGIEFIALQKVTLIPVVAPGFLTFPITDEITPEQMSAYAQCIIRDSARAAAARDYYLVDGAHSWTVGDQLTKKEIIMQGMGWGHMPDFLVAAELRAGQLLSIRGRHFQGGEVGLVAARRNGIAHGPVAQQLWRFIAEQAVQAAQGGASIEGNTRSADCCG